MKSHKKLKKLTNTWAHRRRMRARDGIQYLYATTRRCNNAPCAVSPGALCDKGNPVGVASRRRGGCVTWRDATRYAGLVLRGVPPRRGVRCPGLAWLPSVARRDAVRWPGAAWRAAQAWCALPRPGVAAQRGATRRGALAWCCVACCPGVVCAAPAWRSCPAWRDATRCAGLALSGVLPRPGVAAQRGASPRLA